MPSKKALNHSIFIAAILFAALSSNLFALKALAADSKSPKSELSQEQQVLVVEDYAQAISRHYVVPQKADKYVAFLKDLASDIEQNKVVGVPRDKNAFAEWLNNQLQMIYLDKHLALISPEKFSKIIDQFYDGQMPGVETSAVKGHQKQSAGNDSSSSLAHRGHKSASSRKEGNGLAEIGVLNVGEISRDGLNQTGYLSFSRLESSERAKRFLNMAFSTFSESDQMIIDLRECGGGDAEAVTFLSSFFFIEPTLLSVNEQRDRNTRELIKLERWTAPNRLSEDFKNKPLKILVSEKTFSAAESFAFSMQNLNRATILGEVTGGGGYSNDFFAFSEGFGASISVGRTFNPLNGDDWQGKGIRPDELVQANHALYTALLAYTTESNKLVRLNAEEVDIYNTMQMFVEAWYDGDNDAMHRIINDKFQGVYLDAVSGKEYSVSRENLLSMTSNGKGVNDNKLYNNRIIRDINVSEDIASVTLILRATVHKMILKREKEKWTIVSDFKTDKLRT